MELKEGDKCRVKERIVTKIRKSTQVSEGDELIVVRCTIKSAIVKVPDRKSLKRIPFTNLIKIGN